MGQGLHPLRPAPHHPSVTWESTMIRQLCDINITVMPQLCYCRCPEPKNLVGRLICGHNAPLKFWLLKCSWGTGTVSTHTCMQMHRDWEGSGWLSELSFVDASSCHPVHWRTGMYQKTDDPAKYCWLWWLHNYMPRKLKINGTLTKRKKKLNCFHYFLKVQRKQEWLI